MPKGHAKPPILFRTSVDDRDHFFNPVHHRYRPLCHSVEPPPEIKVKASTSEPESAGLSLMQCEAAVDEEPVLHLSEYKRRAKNGLLWFLSTTAVWQAVSWVLTLVTARMLAPHDYGVVAMGEAVAPYLTLLAGFRLESFTVQKETYSREDEETVCSMLLVLGGSAAFIAFVCAPLLAWFYQEPQVQLPFQLISLVFILRSLQVLPRARLSRKLDFKPLAVSSMATGIFRGAMQLVLACLGFGYWSLIWGLIVNEAALFIWLAWSAGLPRRLAWNEQVVKAAFRYGAAATASTVFWTVFSTADNLVVGKLFGADILGFYAMAFYLAELPLAKLNSAIWPLLVPLFSRLRADIDEAAKAYLSINKSVMLLVAPVLLGLAVSAQEVVSVLLGANWLPLVPILQIMCVVGIWRTMNTCSSQLLLAFDRTRELLVWSILNAAVLPLCFYGLGRLYGLQGIYLTWLFVFPLSGVLVMLEVVQRTVSLRPLEFFRALQAPLVSSIIMFAAVSALEHLTGALFPPAVLLALEIGAGVVVYGLCFVVFFPAEVTSGWSVLKGLRTGIRPIEAAA